MNDKDLPIGVGVLVVKDGKILCGVRSDNGQICGPGGHIEAGETAVDAARRETREEFGITPKDLYQIGALSSSDGQYRPSMVFLCTDYIGEPHCDGEEMYGNGFLNLAEIAELEAFPVFADSIKLLCDTIGFGTLNEDGGKGSGNWGHVGRPGKRGGSGGGGANSMSSPEAMVEELNGRLQRMIGNMSPEERELYDKAKADSASAIKLMEDTFQKNVDTWEAAQTAVKNGQEPVTATAAEKDHTIPGASPECQAAYDASRAKEKGISKDLIGIADEDGSMMYGLDFSVKTGKSVRNKLDRKADAVEEKGDAAVVSGMGDLVRYTQLTDHDSIASTTKATVAKLQEKGYNVIEVDNKYQDPKSDYKGIHIGAVSPTGQTIELQVHSRESMRVKETIHPMYDVSRVKTNPERVRKALQYEMRSISLSMTPPKGVESSDLGSWKK